MKLKSLVVAAAAASALIAGAAQATVTTSPVSVTGPTFTDVVVGTIHVTSLSDILGAVFAADTISFTSPFAGTFSLQAVTFTSVSAGSLVDLDPTGAGFNFHNVAAGDYTLKASGSLSGPAAVPGFGVIRASYDVSPVPEPETYAMMLAGLAAVGFMASRRRQG
jgi:hypothetical protein